MESFLTIVISTILGYFTSVIASKKNKGFLISSIFLVISICLAALVYFGSFYLSYQLKEEKQLEGQWVEEYYENDSIIYGLASFKHNFFSNTIEFSGNGYYRNGDNAGHWMTTKSIYGKNEFNYLFYGESFNKANSGLRKGVGSIWFESNLMKGTGSFFSISSDNVKRRFKLYKLSNTTLIKESIEHPNSFIIKIYTGEYKFE